MPFPMKDYYIIKMLIEKENYNELNNNNNEKFLFGYSNMAPH